MKSHKPAVAIVATFRWNLRSKTSRTSDWNMPTHSVSPDTQEQGVRSAVKAGVAWARGRPLVCQAAITIALVLLTVFQGREGASQFPLVARWLLVALLAGSAWFCSRRFAVAAALCTLGVWSWIEWHMQSWPDLLPGQLVRLAVSLGLVIWLSRLRDRLVEAQRLARIDSLTGLPNRQALIDSLQAELSRSRRFARPFSLAMLDWDGFKKINDQQGHLVGDEVLRRVGVSLREHTRPFDCAGRWGGDEFLVVLSEVDGEDAKLIAERLRASIRHYVERDFPSLAFSLGVVTFQNAELDWPSCVARADATMYAAKRQGRDQTRFEIFHLNGSNPKQAPYPAKPTATASAVINPANADLGASNPNANNPTKAIIGNAANTVDKNGEPTAS